MSELSDDDTTCVQWKTTSFVAVLEMYFFETTLTRNICVKMYRFGSSINDMCVKVYNVFLSAETLWNTLIPLAMLDWICVVWQQLSPNYKIKFNCDVYSSNITYTYGVSAQLAWDLASVIHWYESQPCSCSTNATSWLWMWFYFSTQDLIITINLCFMFPTKTVQLVAVYHLCKR